MKTQFFAAALAATIAAAPALAQEKMKLKVIGQPLATGLIPFAVEGISPDELTRARALAGEDA